ncbi:ABC transporter ATP-binding protein [Microbacterium sp. P01]|uniref:ABC transporter ATP-binding protein n=1 Tax=Microbacterium sp. P01 TaxID=3366261 RepID=UPI00366D54E0
MTMEPASVPTPASASSAGISVEGLRRSFADVHAVVDVTFQAHPGEITALVGPNGSGKTTLLLMLASLLAPDAGRMTVGGADPVADPSAVRSILGWMPDALGAWPSLTARETLVTTARMYRMPRAEASARTEELLALVRLEDLADKPARVFSRGQKQRLGLARALVHNPSVLLLDEPASGLDPQSRIDLRILLRRLAGEGRTILVSSHILAELEELSDTAVFLRGGRTVSADQISYAPERARAWRIRTLDVAEISGADAATAVLRDMGVPPDVMSRERDEIIAPFTSDRAAADALARLTAAGVLVTEFAPVTGRLEQTFLDLTVGDPA